MGKLQSCLILSLFLPSCFCFIEPISTISVAGIALSASYAAWQYAKCSYKECCDDKWIKLDYAGLLNKFKQSLYGQHLVEDIVVRALKGHIKNANPPKALVMSFHGPTGIGKNYVSNFIAESLYEKGKDSDFVHLYVSTVRFPHKSRIEEYRDILQKEIKQAVKKCGRSLFIFDEIDKMPPGVIDVIKPYIDYYDEIEGVDYRKAIFIFLSNAGSGEISKATLKFWHDGQERSSITLKDMERLVNKHAFNEMGGLHGTEIIKRSLIDLYVPFLPLEKKHIEQCIRDRLKRKGGKSHLSQRGIEKILNQIEYVPPKVPVFAESGCKRLEQKINIYGD